VSRSGEISVNDWILACPATRTVWTIEWRGGEWRIGLAVNDSGHELHGVERLPAAVHKDYDTAARNAVEIARLAGFP
jgi:hypothetical protein